MKKIIGIVVLVLVLVGCKSTYIPDTEYKCTGGLYFYCTELVNGEWRICYKRDNIRKDTIYEKD